MHLAKRVSRKSRSVREFVRGLVHTSHPLLVHIIPTRRCNIDCAYCNEYDQVSQPVPLETMYERIDRLATLGTSVVAMSGGEPMLHPDLEAILRRVRSHGMIAGLITNGYLLSPKKIAALNDAGLDYLQISIDNVEPDGVSKKSLRLLDTKLQWLRDHAAFDININSVIGGGVKDPEDARTINRRARALGFSTSIGIIHDEAGRLKPLAALEREIFDEITGQISGAWQIAQVARHPMRPYTADYLRQIAPDFQELHGDRMYADDPAIIGGIGRLDGRPIMFIGHQKGRDTKERVRRNYGMPKPEGYRKAQRLMKMAQKFSLPIVTFIDTPGAYPGLGAEERGQSEAIAYSLFLMAKLIPSCIGPIR